jgi:CheY-specific phosphatase CheX
MASARPFDEVIEPTVVHSSDVEELSRVAVDAACHVLRIYGLSAAGPEAAAGDLDPAQIVALIGFNGEVLKGTLAIIAPTELIRRSCPSLVLEPGFSEREVFDWAGELVNMMLGRIKVALAARGVEVDSSTPRMMLASQLKVERSIENTICSTCLPVGSLRLTLWFDAVASRAEPLLAGETCQDASPPEGEVLLFD